MSEMVGGILIGILLGFFLGSIATSYLIRAFITNDWLWPFKRK